LAALAVRFVEVSNFVSQEVDVQSEFGYAPAQAKYGSQTHQAATPAME
jgi:hypothetical protein